MPDKYRATKDLDGLIPYFKIGGNMNLQMYTNFPDLHYYRLEPHDGTRYEFFFFDPFKRAGKSETLETSMEMVQSEDPSVAGKAKVISYHDREKSFAIPIIGIFDGEGYIMLGIVMPSGQGVHPVSRASLNLIREAWLDHNEPKVADHISYMIDYWRRHTANIVYAPTITVCILALAMLVDDPYVLDEAVRIASRGMEIHSLAFEALHNVHDHVSDLKDSF